MSIFFKSRTVAPAAGEVLKEALTIDPKTIGNIQQKAQEMAQQVNTQTTVSFAWNRFIAAIIFIVLLFVGGIYTSQHEKLEAWGTVLLHIFEITLGGVVGIIIGEKTAKA